MNKKLLFITILAFYCYLTHAQIPVFNWFTFQKDLQIGQPDINSNVIEGTEVMWLINHKGKIYSATSFWNNATFHGAQMLVKKNYDTAWEVDYQFPQNVGRNDALNSFQFTKDRYGNVLAQADTLLIASCATAPFGTDRYMKIWTRNDQTNTWVASAPLDTNLNVNDSYMRSFTFHTDGVTGIEYVFAGGSNGKLYKGAYDASLPNKMFWDTIPEITMQSAERFHSGAVCNGRLYIAGAPNASYPNEGGLYLRIDAVNPTWERVYTWSPSVNAGMRGLTAVPDPTNPSSQVLIGTREAPGTIERIVPMPNDTVNVITEITDLRQEFTNIWGDLGGNAALSAYNRLDIGNNPITGERVWFLGLYINHPSDTGTVSRNNSWMLMRNSLAQYHYCQVIDSSNSIPSRFGLRGTRTILQSPFSEDSGSVYYLGGFDAHNGPHTNSAWIYKATVRPELVLTTIINNALNSKQISVYPNPTNTTLFIQSESNNPLQYQIINSLGQIVLHGSVNENSIDVSRLFRGIYFIQLNDKKGQVLTSKFIKE